MYESPQILFGGIVHVEELTHIDNSWSDTLDLSNVSYDLSLMNTTTNCGQICRI